MSICGITLLLGVFIQLVQLIELACGPSLSNSLICVLAYSFINKKADIRTPLAEDQTSQGRPHYNRTTGVALGGLVVSVLATGPKVRGFKPGRGRWILRVISDKIRSTPSFGGEVKPSVPCRRFTAC
jgi:hypothetical protein